MDCQIKVEYEDDQQEEEIEDIFSNENGSWSLEEDPLALDDMIKNENEGLYSGFISVPEILKQELIIKDEKIEPEENKCNNFEVETLETRTSKNEDDYHSQLMTASSDDSDVSLEGNQSSENNTVSSHFTGEVGLVRSCTSVPFLINKKKYRPIAKHIAVDRGFLTNPDLYVKNLQNKVDAYEEVVLNMCRKAYRLEKAVLRKKPSKLMLKKWLHLRFFRY